MDPSVLTLKSVEGRSAGEGEYRYASEATTNGATDDKEAMSARALHVDGGRREGALVRRRPFIRPLRVRSVAQKSGIPTETALHMYDVRLKFVDKYYRIRL